MTRLKLSRERAEELAAELLASEPRFRDSATASWISAVVRLGCRCDRCWSERPNPFVSPAASLWPYFHKRL